MFSVMDWTSGGVTGLELPPGWDELCPVLWLLLWLETGGFLQI